MYLVLNFKSGGVVLTPPSKKTKMDDVIINSGGIYEDRAIKPIEEVLIPKHCAINMLHVLCGLPPVSHYNKNERFKWDDNIVEAIDNSYIKYDFKPTFDIVYKEDGTFYYKSQHGEMFQSAKAKVNSHSIHETPIICPITKKTIYLQGIHSWAAWRRYLGYELFNDVIKYFEEYFSMKYEYIKANYDLTEIIALIKDIQLDSYEELNTKLKKAGKTPIANIIGGNFSSANYNSYTTNYPNIIRNGIKQMLKLSGNMIIKITDEMLEMISNNDGVATILDGGVVSIVDTLEDIDSQEMLEYEGWVKIGSV